MQTLYNTYTYNSHRKSDTIVVCSEISIMPVQTFKILRQLTYWKTKLEGTITMFLYVHAAAVDKTPIERIIVAPLCMAIYPSINCRREHYLYIHNVILGHIVSSIHEREDFRKKKI